MNRLIAYALPIYIVLFFYYVYVIQNKRISKKTNAVINQLPKDDTIHSLLGMYFKVVHYTTIISLVIQGIYPSSMNHLHPIKFIKQNAFIYLGLICLTICSILAILSQKEMKNSWRMGIDYTSKTTLITHGIFGYSRNPFFVCLIGIFLSLFLILPNILTLFLWIIEWMLITLQIRLEEAYLTSKHGQNYLDYTKKTPRYLGIKSIV